MHQTLIQTAEYTVCWAHSKMRFFHDSGIYEYCSLHYFQTLCTNPAKESVRKIPKQWTDDSLSLFYLVHSSLFILSPGFLVLYLKVIWLAGGMMPRPARLLSSIASCWFSSNCISQMSKATHTNCFSSFIAKKRPGHCVAPEPKGIR